jgi:hypothetical protein
MLADGHTCCCSSSGAHAALCPCRSSLSHTLTAAFLMLLPDMCGRCVPCPPQSMAVGMKELSEFVSEVAPTVSKYWATAGETEPTQRPESRNP